MLELLAEFLLQMILEALAELGLHSVKEPFRKPPNPWFAAVGYGIFGVIAGIISLFIVPHHLVQGGILRLANLIVSPLLAGLVMSLVGRWRVRQGQAIWRIDRFAYGYFFALALASVRFFFAH